MQQRRAMALIASLLGALAPVSANAKAGALTGEDFLRYCVTDDPDKPAADQYEQEMITYCSGYMEGIITALVMLPRETTCIPKGAAPADIYGATISFLRNHEDQKSELLGAVILAAARAQWGCH